LKNVDYRLDKYICSYREYVQEKRDKSKEEFDKYKGKDLNIGLNLHPCKPKPKQKKPQRKYVREKRDKIVKREIEKGLEKNLNIPEFLIPWVSKMRPLNRLKIPPKKWK